MTRLQRARGLARLYAGYIRGDEEVRRLPARVWIEPTPACNFKCGHCPNSMNVKFPTGLMTMELFRKIIDELDGHVMDVNLFHRGESLIHPRLAEMVAYCNARGMRTRLHTNAGLMTEKRARELIEAGLSYISFSVDGYTKEVYDKARLGGDFDETISNILNFLRIKRQTGNGNPFTIMQVMEIGEEEENVARRRKAFTSKFKDAGINRFVIRTPHNWGGDLSRFGNGTDVESGRRFTPCSFLWYSMTIFFDGTVAPCPQDFFGKINVGSVADDTVENVWNNEVMRNMRRRMKQRDVADLSPCQTCDILKRKTFMGVPVDYLFTFLKDNFLIK